jgi:hypothetical protein
LLPSKTQVCIVEKRIKCFLHISYHNKYEKIHSP